MLALKSQLRQVRQELGDLLYQQQHLLLVLGPNLEARYHSLIGKLELELVQAQLESRRLKRQIELCRSQLARFAAIDHAEVQQTLDRELASWRRQIREHRQRLEDSEKRLQSLASPETSAIVRSLYRQLVKRFHPDLNPQQSQDRAQLWYAVQKSYQQRNWRQMETLLAATDEEWDESPSELARLSSRCEELKHDLDELQKQFPYHLERQLEDPDWVQKRDGELKLIILLERQRALKLAAVLQELWVPP